MVHTFQESRMAGFLSNVTIMPDGRASALLDIAPASFLDVAAAVIIGFGSLAYLFPKQTWDKPDPYQSIWFERPQNRVDIEGNASQTTRNIAQRLGELVEFPTP